MNNTVNNTNNVSFNARYLKIINSKKLPQRISDAIYKSDAVYEFLKAGKPKTLWGKFIDLFRKDEALEIKYEILKVQEHSNYDKKTFIERLQDPYQKVGKVTFTYKQRNGEEKTFELVAEQSGRKRQKGSIPKPNENYAYKPPVESSESKLEKQINTLKKLDNFFQ